MKLISIVCPVYNEESGIEWFHDQLCDTLKSIKSYKFEIIYVNDGSRDNSIQKLHALKPNNHSSVVVIDLSRNFGKEPALSAGLASAKGDAAIMLDSDGQHPVALLRSFIKIWEEGAEVVIGVRRSNKNEGLIKRYGSELFYQLFNKFSGTQLTPRSTDYRLVDRTVINEFVNLKERNRITRGLIDWLGFRREYIEFDADERRFGVASYSFKKLVELAVNTFVSLSSLPLYISGYAGAFFILASSALGVFIIVEQIILGDPMKLAVSGSAMLGVLLVFLVGIILSAQGLIGVYVSRLLSEGQGRPLFIIREIKYSKPAMNRVVKGVKQ